MQQLTVRSFSDEVREHLLAAIRRKALAAAASAGAPEPEIRMGEEGTPSLWNDTDLTARLAKYAAVKQAPPSLHSPIYYPDPELTLATGVTTMSAVVLELLKPRK